MPVKKDGEKLPIIYYLVQLSCIRPGKVAAQDQVALGMMCGLCACACAEDPVAQTQSRSDPIHVLDHLNGDFELRNMW